MQYITNPSRAGLLAGLADAGGVGDGGPLPTNTGGGHGRRPPAVRGAGRSDAPSTGLR